MQFKHPELLWALLLLLIPIIVHLFQLRRFQTVAFTNVKFLKNVELQTRKSSQLKKWLTLFTRLLLITCIVLAFAQPFTANTDAFNAKNETVIYLDNSFSMQAKGANGSLLNEAIQDIIKNTPQDDKITLFTNTTTYRNTTVKSISNDLIKLNHTSNQLSYKAAYLKGKQLFSNDKTSVKNLVLISDFQQQNEVLNFEMDSSITLKLVQPKIINTSNISIDSLYISKQSVENLELKVHLSHIGEPIDNVSVSLFNAEELIAKTAVDIDKKATTTFTIPNSTSFEGKLSIEDVNLQYDNALYFNLNISEKIKVLSINEASDTFLKKLYTGDEFEYASFDVKTLDYNRIEDQNLIVLNELNNIPISLINSLNAFKINGGSILIIVSERTDITSYNQLLSSLNLPQLDTLIPNEKRITTLNYDHPIIEDAFYNRVSNFQYPKVNSSYSVSNSVNAVFTFDDSKPFLVGKNKCYLFTAAINNKNGNFKKSPLIVPVLYNLGKQSLELPELYYTINKKNTIDISTQIGQDDILSLQKNEISIIPLQKTFSKKVSLITEDLPPKAGIYNVVKDSKTLKQLSFNHGRKESDLNYYNIEPNPNYSLSNSFSVAMDAIKSNTRINALWKWFVIFALVFLLIEMLILKYLK